MTQTVSDDDLKRVGYAMGFYQAKCTQCGGRFCGDKRATCCRACAVKLLETAKTKPMQDKVSDEDRAKQLFKHLDDKCMDYEGYESWLSEELAVPEFVKTFAAIRADERERCAQIAEKQEKIRWVIPASEAIRSRKD